MRQNVVFIHAVKLERHEEILESYINLMIKSGLMDKLECIYIFGYGGDINLSNYHEKIIMINLPNPINLYEQITLENLYDFCKRHPVGYNILYLHTKGVGKPINQAIEDWRNYMCYFLIEKHANCIQLLDSFDAVGVDLLVAPQMHFSGNFFWTTAEHINTLRDAHGLMSLSNVLNSPRHNHEFWICSRPTGMYASLHQSNISCFERHIHTYPRENYCFEN